MSAIVQRLTERQLISPPDYVQHQTQYEVMMGSVAYGVSSDTSDVDIYGFCIPNKEIIFPHLNGEIEGFGKQKQRFEQYQKHHIIDNDAKKQYDLTIYNIVKYFQLCMENNPNMIDSLFVPQRCILHITQIGNLVRENRKLFLHKGSWHKFKGYAFSQIHKIKTKNPEGKRKEIIEKFNYDCYHKDTEFLTEYGWLKYDKIQNHIKLGTINNIGEIDFVNYTNKIEKYYNGVLYLIEPYLNKFCVTPTHQLLVSAAHKNISNKFSSKYNPLKSNWIFKSISTMQKEHRSNYHIARYANKRIEDYPVLDEYLKLAGLYISEGTAQFRGNEIFCRLTQTLKGKIEVFECLDELQKYFNIKKYNYIRSKILSAVNETTWIIDKITSKLLIQDFRFLNLKRLPLWTLKLSHRQAMILWKHLIYGDGTKTYNLNSEQNGEVYYTSSKSLADDIQAMLISCGDICTIREYKNVQTNIGITNQYQVYKPINPDQFYCVNFNRILKVNQNKNKKDGYAIKEISYNDKIICFEVPTHILITRLNGKIGIQGNCKFAYHTVRLMNEVEQILIEGDLDLERNREQLKSIRRGEWKEEDIYNYFNKKELELESLYISSKLKHSPNQNKIKELLLNCLELHYGSLEKVIKKDTSVDSLISDLKELIKKYSGE